MAAVLAFGDSAVLSHRSAAALWGLRGERGGLVDVTLPIKSRHVPGIRRHSSRVLAPDEITVEFGIPVTTVPRTIFDCASGGDVDLVENLMRQAANHQKLRIPLVLPGITISTSPTDYYPIQAVQLARFKAESWELFGDVMHAESS